MTDYDKANAEMDKAWAVFDPIRTRYTDVSIPLHERPTTKEFDAAMKVFRAAQRKFDEAFAKAQKS